MSAVRQFRIARGKCLKCLKSLLSDVKRTFGFTVAAFDGPVVVAVMISGSFAVVQQTVAALFQCQRAVGAQIELVAIIRMGVRLFAVFLRALRRLFVFLAPDHWETTR